MDEIRCINVLRCQLAENVDSDVVTKELMRKEPLLDIV
jgi:hypothetical protein